MVYGETQGTTYYIKYFSKNETIKKSAIDSILRQFDLSVSTYEPTSIISRINQGEHNMQLDDFFIGNFNLSKEIHQDTEGLFDPTIGTLVNAYGFGPQSITMEMNPKVLDSLMKLVGLEKTKLVNQTLVKNNPHIYLDFNAIAQGYAVDVLADYLKSKGIKNAIIEVGGEIFAFGNNQEKKQAWVTGIENPIKENAEDRNLIAKIELTDLGLATSGNYRKIKTDSLTGQKFVHIINPKTGNATTTNVLSVTVLAPSTAQADAYATALMLMDLEAIKKFIAARPQLYAFVVYEEQLKTNQWFSNNLKNLLKE